MAQLLAFGVLFLQFLPGKDLSFKALCWIRALSALFLLCSLALHFRGFTTVGLLMTAGVALIAAAMVVASWRHPLPLKALFGTRRTDRQDQRESIETRQER